MNPTTLDALADFPVSSKPISRPSPTATRAGRPTTGPGCRASIFAARQLCHVRDIEIDGYHVRLRRMLDEDRPLLVSIDGDALAIERRYNDAYASDVLAAIREARARRWTSCRASRPNSSRAPGNSTATGADRARRPLPVQPRPAAGRHAVAARQDRRDAVRAEPAPASASAPINRGRIRRGCRCGRLHCRASIGSFFWIIHPALPG